MKRQTIATLVLLASPTCVACATDWHANPGIRSNRGQATLIAEVA